MPPTPSGAIKQALVATLRANGTLVAALTGGIHEGFAPEKKPYPLLVYYWVADPYTFTHTTAEHNVLVDIRVFDDNSVDANNIDALVFSTLDGAALAVTGQSLVLCHRVADFSDPDTDEEGRKIYSVGGTYEIMTYMPRA